MFDECCIEPPRSMKMRVTGANAQVINAVPVESTQRDYAITRLRAIGNDHAQALRKQFHMDGNRPKSAAELIAAIENKTYTLDTKTLASHAEDIKRGYYNNEFGINWGPPPDLDGYNAAGEVLKTAAQKALDKATLGSVDSLEATIDDYEAWAYTA